MTVGSLAVRFRRAIGTVRDEDESWVTLDRPGLERRTDVDATGARSWLAFGDEAANLALLLDRAP